ncbi:hypothetical protein LZ30DRAFT_602253 [Colletotrichum cereale]|nr:hypothetical protein LZ30DRAFT_602253 [Colletotrichum cereale]
MAQLTATSFSTDPALWIFTSLTAGSSHIVTATSRLETILRANRVPFKAIDLATDQKARMLWGRRAGKDASGRVRKLPALVQEGLVLGDITEIEEWNEYGELKQHVKIYYDEFTIPDINNKPKEPIKKKIIKKVPKGTLSGNASASASTSAPTSASAPAPPPAPPLPKDESSTPAPAKDKSVETSRAPADNSSTVVHRSIADEAAKKAKELRLQSLRDKVYGKTDVKAAEGKKPETEASSVATTEVDKKAEAVTDASKEPETPRKPSVATTSSGFSAQSVKPVGLQSPTTGSWGAAATDFNTETLRETLQSPTTARWKPSDVGKPVTMHMGAAVASASQEEIAAVEKAEAIKEEPDQETSDEDVDASQKQIAEVEKVQAIKEEPEKEVAEDPTKAAVLEKETVPKKAPAAEKTENTTKAPQPEEEEDDDEDDEDDDDDDDSDDSDDNDEDDASGPETNTDGAKVKSGSEEKEVTDAKTAEPNKSGEPKPEGEAKPEGEPEE